MRCSQGIPQLHSTLRLARHTLEKAEVELQVDLAPDLHPIEGDAGALDQVFLNLLKNAAEALEGRGGAICVDTRREQAGIVAEIRDNGPGVAPEVQERLFEPFFSTKEAGSGTGLGLSVSRRIVTEQGGSIEVASAPGEGTTFSVRLPMGGFDRAA